MFASRLALYFQLSRTNPSPKACLGLERIVPIISNQPPNQLTRCAPCAPAQGKMLRSVGGSETPRWGRSNPSLGKTPTPVRETAYPRQGRNDLTQGRREELELESWSWRVGVGGGSWLSDSVAFGVSWGNAPKKLCFEGQIRRSRTRRVRKHPRKAEDAERFWSWGVAPDPRKTLNQK